jgi:hypothetical protein
MGYRVVSMPSSPRGAALLAAAMVLAACGSDVSRSVGARCDVLAECEERCLTGPEFPGGFCSLSCQVEDDCGGGGDIVCVDLEGGVCLFECQVAGDCDFLGPGWGCAPELSPAGEEVMACRGS